MPVAGSRQALVRAAEDQDAAYVNAEHEAGQRAREESLRHYLNAGRRLLDKRKQFPPRSGWLRWLKENVRFSQPTAHRYMAFAEECAALLFTTNSKDETNSKDDLSLEQLQAAWDVAVHPSVEEEQGAAPGEGPDDAAGGQDDAEGKEAPQDDDDRQRRNLTLFSRLRMIEHDLHSKAGIVVSDLAKQWSVSYATIRSDLDLFVAGFGCRLDWKNVATTDESGQKKFRTGVRCVREAGSGGDMHADD
jgi:hypothetical protein